MKRAVKILAILLLLLAMTLPLYAQETCKVLRIVDGDTLKVLYQSNEESIRLIGIDTPESRVSPRANKESQRTGQDLKTILALGKTGNRFCQDSRQAWRFGKAGVRRSGAGPIQKAFGIRLLSQWEDVE